MRCQMLPILLGIFFVKSLRFYLNVRAGLTFISIQSWSTNLLFYLVSSKVSIFEVEALFGDVSKIDSSLNNFVLVASIKFRCRQTFLKSI
jgi:hypothetical protein